VTCLGVAYAVYWDQSGFSPEGALELERQGEAIVAVLEDHRNHTGVYPRDL